MPEYRYSARNETGLKVQGIVDANTESEAASALAANGLFPLEVAPISQQVVTGKVRKISGQKMAAFYSQLADLLHSGVPLLKSLKIMHDQSSNPNLKYVLDNVSRLLEEGLTLPDAMARYQTVFGEMGVQMIRAGSEGGFLEESLHHVAQYTETQDDLKNRVSGAMVYPVILAIFLLLVVVVILAYFIPLFEPLFAKLRAKGDLPILTEWVLFAGRWMKLIVLIVTPTVILGIIWFRNWGKTESGRRAIDRFKLKAFIIGPLYQGFAVARFCRVLGTLLKNGVPIIKSLDISADATGNKVLADAIHNASENITSGAKLAEPLAKSKCFPVSVVEMISVAEESNALETVLVDISESLEKRNWRALDIATRFIEPLMLILLGGVILVVVIAIMLPIFRIGQSI